MADIFHHYPIKAPAVKVYHAISTPEGFDIWWSKKASGKPSVGEIYKLYFGEDYNWEAIVTKCISNKEFELTMTKSDDDWKNSKVGFTLIEKPSVTEVHFYHTGWKEPNEHFKISNFCWAMYLRILKRNLEFGEEVEYENRLSV